MLLKLVDRGHTTTWLIPLWLHGAARTELYVHTSRSRGRFAARCWTDRAEDGGCAQGGGATPRGGQSFLRFDRVRKRDRSQAYFERQLEGRMSALGLGRVET